MAQESVRVLGADVAARFGVSFPIRFDYLDTLEGGHLSLQCHPPRAYARELFGLDYTQDETYYVMETTPGASVFLGLAGGRRPRTRSGPRPRPRNAASSSTRRASCRRTTPSSTGST